MSGGEYKSTVRHHGFFCCVVSLPMADSHTRAYQQTICAEVIRRLCGRG